LFEAVCAVWEAFYANAAAARQSASKALALGRSREVDYVAAPASRCRGGAGRRRATALTDAVAVPRNQAGT
jgi:hypothetical protein